MPRAAADIRPAKPLRHDAFKANFASVAKHHLAVALHVLVKSDRDINGLGLPFVRTLLRPSKLRNLGLCGTDNPLVEVPRLIGTSPNARFILPTNAR
jgi:hypothetical protein